MAIEPAADLSADVSAWVPVTLGQAQLALSSASTSRRLPALRMDFDFKDGGGFVVARRVVQRSMHEDYAVRFRLRGRGGANDLEIKLIDGTGLSVWRHVIKDLQPPARWKSIKIDSREVQFAWGPASGGLMTELGAIEIAIVARAGGTGTMWFSDLRIEDCSPGAAPTASASSALPGFDAGQALGGAGWTPRPDDAKPWITVDFTEPRRLGGLVIDWRDGAPASGFRVRGSSSGRRWQILHATRRAGGEHSHVYSAGLEDEVSASATERAERPVPLYARSRSSSRVRSTPSGSTSPAVSRAAGTRAGCIASRACGRQLAPRTVRIAPS